MNLCSLLIPGSLFNSLNLKCSNCSFWFLLNCFLLCHPSTSHVQIMHTLPIRLSKFSNRRGVARVLFKRLSFVLTNSVGTLVTLLHRNPVGWREPQLPRKTVTKTRLCSTVGVLSASHCRTTKENFMCVVNVTLQQTLNQTEKETNHVNRKYSHFINGSRWYIKPTDG